MIDTNLTKSESEKVSDRLKTKNYELDCSSFFTLESERKEFQTAAEDLQAQRNSLSKDYGLLKKEGKEDASLTKRIEETKGDFERFLPVCSKTCPRPTNPKSNPL